jgi:predicted nucleic acid-binding protein
VGSDEMSDRIYLDCNCFQRGFDDHRQVRIRLEAAACEEVFAEAEAGTVRLVWSFMHEDERALCPFPERAVEAMNLSSLCAVRIGPTEDIRTTALSFQQKATLSARDAVHLACAHSAGADVLLTCDDDFLQRATRVARDLTVMNPVDYVRSKQGGW